MLIGNRVGKLRGKKNHSNAVAKNIVNIMKYFSWNLNDVMALNCAQYFTLVKIINEIERDSKEKAKKNK